MIGVLCALYILVIVAAGVAAWGTIQRDRSEDWAVMLGTAIALGLGAVGTALMFASLLGIAVSRVTIGAIALIAVLAIAWWWGRARIDWPKLQPPGNGLLGWPWLLPVAGIVFGGVYWCATAWGLPLWEWDAFVIWGLKAKVVYHEPLVPRPDYFTDKSLSFSHLNYPLLTPFLTVGAWKMVGAVHEQAGRAHLPLYYVSMMLLTFALARGALGTLAGASLGLVVAACPVMLLYGGVGGADVPLTAFHLAGAFWTWRWLQSGTARDAILAGIFAGFCALTKQEGLAIAFVQSVVFGAFAVMSIRTRWKSAMLAILIALAISLPWLVYRAGIPDTAVPYASRLNVSTIVDNIGRLKPILLAMGGQLIAFDIFGAFWLVWILAVLAGFHGFARKENLGLWVLFLGQVGVKILAYVITTWDIEDHLQNSVSRVMMHTMGAAILLTVAHSSALADRVRAFQHARATRFGGGSLQ